MREIHGRLGVYPIDISRILISEGIADREVGERLKAMDITEILNKLYNSQLINVRDANFKLGAKRRDRQNDMSMQQL